MEGEERGDLGVRWEDGGEGRVDQGEGKGICGVCGVWVIVRILAFV